MNNSLATGLICNKCGKVVKTATSYKEKLYCNNCYQQEMRILMKDLEVNCNK